LVVVFRFDRVDLGPPEIERLRSDTSETDSELLDSWPEFVDRVLADRAKAFCFHVERLQLGPEIFGQRATVCAFVEIHS
jgi:hypothetical protein